MIFGLKGGREGRGELRKSDWREGRRRRRARSLGWRIRWWCLEWKQRESLTTFLVGRVWGWRVGEGGLRCKYPRECSRYQRLLMGGRRSLLRRIRSVREQSRAHFQRLQCCHAEFCVS